MVFSVRLAAIIVAIALCTTFSTGIAAQRVVMFEEITSGTCPPCASSNPPINAMLEEYGSQVAAVKWHVWWPSHNPLDPFFRSNEQPVRNRVFDYYHVIAAPWVIIEGQFVADAHDTDAQRAIIDTQLQVPSPIAIAATGTRNGMDVNISIDITVETPTAGDTRLFVALTEELAPCAQPPNGCSNGETVHHDVHRKINANNTYNGVPVNLTAIGVQHFDQTLSMNPVTPTNPPVNPDQINVVIWVQEFGSFEMIQGAEITPVESVGIPLEGAPVVARLGQNNPNPFAATTAIEYALASPAHVQLRVYDINGNVVRELTNGQRGADTYRVDWDGKDDAGNQLASGIYFYEMTAPGIRESRRMVLIR